MFFENSADFPDTICFYWSKNEGVVRNTHAYTTRVSILRYVFVRSILCRCPCRVVCVRVERRLANDGKTKPVGERKKMFDAGNFVLKNDAPGVYIRTKPIIGRISKWGGCRGVLETAVVRRKIGARRTTYSVNTPRERCRGTVCETIFFVHVPGTCTRIELKCRV